MEHAATVQAKIREFEARVRQWRQLRFGLSDALHFIPGQRTSSTDRGVVVEESPPSPFTPSSSHTRPNLHLPIGSATAPLPRRNIMSRGGFEREGLKMPKDDDKVVSDANADLKRCMAELQKHANKLTIGDIILKVKRESEVIVHETIGQGNFGVVQMAVIKGHPMAIKKIFKVNITDSGEKYLYVELSISVKQHECPYIVRYYGFLNFNAEFSICMEKAQMCLKTAQGLIPDHRVEERVLQRIITDTVFGLKFLKDKYSILHRDIKPSNILLSINGISKLCDFGISGVLMQSFAKSKTEGCPPYMAPERLTHDEKQPLHSGHYDVRSDIWSVGITTVELATGRHPFPIEKPEFEVLQGVKDGPAPRLSTDRGYSENLVKFIELVLEKNPLSRPKYDRVIETDFIKEGSEMNHEHVARWMDGLRANRQVQ